MEKTLTLKNMNVLQIDRQTIKHINGQTDRQTDTCEVDRQTQIDRQTEVDIWTD